MAKAELIAPFNPDNQNKYPDPLVKGIIRAGLGLYLHHWHDFKVTLDPETPKEGPYIALTAHGSILDAIVGMVADPYREGTAPIIKAELAKHPLMGKILALWEAIPVARNRNDTKAVREIFKRLKMGKGTCIAPEGTRTRTGRMGPLNKTLVRIVLRGYSEQGAKIIPMAVRGSYEALPPGAKFPKHTPLELVSGPPIDLSPWREGKLNDEELAAPAYKIREAIGLLLPEHNRALPTTPILKP